MQYELEPVEDGRYVRLSLYETPPSMEAMFLNESIHKELARLNASRLIVDYRDLSQSDFDATVARAILLQMSRLLRSAGRSSPWVLKIAALSVEGTLGHGIARMTVSHGYGLDLLDLQQFVDEDEAMGWLLAES